MDCKYYFYWKKKYYVLISLGIYCGRYKWDLSVYYGEGVELY